MGNLVNESIQAAFLAWCDEASSSLNNIPPALERCMTLAIREFAERVAAEWGVLFGDEKAMADCMCLCSELRRAAGLEEEE